jgi:hypothetical protein
MTVETPLGQLEESIVVAGPLEGLDAAPDHDQLKKISAATGGKHLSPGDNLLEEIESRVKMVEKEFIEEKRFPIWATPIVLVIVLGLLCSEWYFRRRWGLI